MVLLLWRNRMSLVTLMHWNWEILKTHSKLGVENDVSKKIKWNRKRSFTFLYYMRSIKTSVIVLLITLSSVSLFGILLCHREMVDCNFWHYDWLSYLPAATAAVSLPLSAQEIRSVSAVSGDKLCFGCQLQSVLRKWFYVYVRVWPKDGNLLKKFFLFVFF